MKKSKSSKQVETAQLLKSNATVPLNQLITPTWEMHLRKVSRLRRMILIEYLALLMKVEELQTVRLQLRPPLLTKEQRYAKLKIAIASLNGIVASVEKYSLLSETISRKKPWY